MSPLKPLHSVGVTGPVLAGGPMKPYKQGPFCEYVKEHIGPSIFRFAILSFSSGVTSIPPRNFISSEQIALRPPDRALFPRRQPSPGDGALSLPAAAISRFLLLIPIPHPDFISPTTLSPSSSPLPATAPSLGGPFMTTALSSGESNGSLPPNGPLSLPQ
ncbi:hypothetical protein KSP40_PGU015472 [Platanthera guangdongensis]|uniref:Uncharacterized protein n=1 Tax=Platanthera guangdongensis TaxID=2320717 RepID=A0ABR2LGP4_9ASPA